MYTLLAVYSHGLYSEVEAGLSKLQMQKEGRIRDLLSPCRYKFIKRTS